jgi:conserved oligomeric Golgi complex subunit 1
MSRLLKHGQSSLLPAKILVLSRLTHKTLSQRPHPPPLNQSLRNRLTSLRRKLLHTIDKRLSNPDADIHMLVEEMCAFSLATSSTPTDVLRHFHHVRLEVITLSLDQRKANHDDILKAMKSYLRTLRDSQLIFPKRLADALAKLRLQPLLQQKDVRSTAGLSLHLHERWISDELRNYTPWPRHDELQLNEAEKLLQAWAKEGLSAFLSGTKSVLEHPHEVRHYLWDLEKIMKLRKAIFEVWPWSAARLSGLDPSEVVDQLRRLFNDRLSQEANNCVSRIQQFALQISSLVEQAQTTGNTYQSTTLWSPTVLSTEYTNGAETFKHTILATYNGEDELVHECTKSYDAWLDTIASLRNAIKQMRDTRWDDDHDSEEEEQEAAEITLASKQRLLSREDPELLAMALESSLKAATNTFHQALHDIATKLLQPPPAPIIHQHPTIFLLRLFRHIHHRNSTADYPPLPQPLICNLHQHVTTAVAIPPCKALASSLQKLSGKTALAERALWEGEPKLPVQPGPGVFRLLRGLVAGMEGVGADIWGAGAVGELKTVVERKVVKIVKGWIDGIADGEEEVEKVVQVLFDVLYLQRVVASGRGLGGSELEGVVGELVRLAGLDDVAVNRMRKSAAEYWRKSYLLFALLAD